MIAAQNPSILTTRQLRRLGRTASSSNAEGGGFGDYGLGGRGVPSDGAGKSDLRWGYGGLQQRGVVRHQGGSMLVCFAFEVRGETG